MIYSTNRFLKEEKIKLAGHCYIASEAAYYLLGGSKYWIPCQINHEGVSHWFLRKKSNNLILDITASQFKTIPDYSKARGKGFLTKEPSKRTQTLLNRIIKNTGEFVHGRCT